MRFFFILVVLLLAAISIQAQTAYPDLIVLKNKDSIRCAFRSSTPQTLFYYRPGKDGKPLRRSVERSSTLSYDQGYYARREAGPGNPVSIQPLTYYTGKEGLNPEGPVRKGYLRLGAGFGQRLQSEGATSGVTFGGSVGSLLGRYMGAGIRIEGYSATQGINSCKSMFAGLEAFVRGSLNPSKSSYVFFGGGLGILKLRQVVKIRNSSYGTIFNQTGVAPHLMAGIHVQAAPALGFQFQVGGMAGKLGSKYQRVDIWRLGPSASLVLTF